MNLPEGVSEEPYAVLGVARTASMEDLRKTFRERARRCHPDQHGGDKKREAEFTRLSAAYSLINTPERRRAFAQLMRDANPTWTRTPPPPPPPAPPPVEAFAKKEPKPKAKTKRAKRAKKVSVEIDPWADQDKPWAHGASSAEMLASLYAQSDLRRGARGNGLKLEIYLDEEGVRTTKESLETLKSLQKAARSAAKAFKPLWNLLR